MTTTDPFFIEGPACVSFSGGRTSGYMLRRILDAYGGTLPDDVHVVFANTGKERSETLDFVRDCGERWNVRIRWIELLISGEQPEMRHAFREVSFDTASRRGEPFSAMIEARRYLPNPVARICTQELKIRPMNKFARSLGFEHWTNVVGLRADEPRRVAKIKAPSRERFDLVAPLADAGVTLADVQAFWGAVPFDLRLMQHEGNCDLCFLKGRARIERIMRARPDLAAWWIEQESRGYGAHGDALFRHDRPSYAAQLARIRSLPMLPGLDLDAGDENALPCACTD